VVLHANQAARILDSLNRLPMVRKSAYYWRTTADATQRSADSLRQASIHNLEAKEAAERAEQLQHSVAISNGVKYAEANRKAHRRGFIIYFLIAWNALTGYYLITH
jgi:hypothetical protein